MCGGKEGDEVWGKGERNRQEYCISTDQNTGPNTRLQKVALKLLVNIGWWLNKDIKLLSNVHTGRRILYCLHARYWLGGKKKRAREGDVRNKSGRLISANETVFANTNILANKIQ